MKIGIDISQIVYGTGVSVYTRELVKNLAAEFPKNEYVLYGGSLRRQGELKAFVDSISNAKARLSPISPSMADLLWNRLHVLNIEKLVGNVDIFHSSDWAEPPANCPKVTTIHDLSPVVMPEHTPKRIVDVHKRKLYWAAKEADMVIVPTESSRVDALRLGIANNRLRVIPEALRSDFKKALKKDVEFVKKKNRVLGQFALAVGTNPRKNTTRIVQAFEKTKADTKLSKLVIIGSRPENLRDSRNVIFTGPVSNHDLAALYSGASVLIYPSLYEGFGLPILEAFACGCPVVTSNISSMPEVAGSAAVLVDPQSVESIAEGVREALSGGTKLAKAAKTQLNKFSWENTARKTMEAYRAVLSVQK